MNEHKKNTPRKVVYVASNFTTGLSDLVLTVRKPDGSILGDLSAETAPTFTEQGEGIYTAEYTPDTDGVWQEKVTSATNGDKVFKSYVVGNYKLDDIKSDTESIKTKTDNLPNDTATELNTIKDNQTDMESKIDEINIETNPGGYFA